jgi:hypothetical protein
LERDDEVLERFRLEKRYRWIRNGSVHVINVERLDEEYLSERYAREGRLDRIGPAGKSKRHQVIGT